MVFTQQRTRLENRILAALATCAMRIEDSSDACSTKGCHEPSRCRAQLPECTRFPAGSRSSPVPATGRPPPAPRQVRAEPCSHGRCRPAVLRSRAQGALEPHRSGEAPLLLRAGPSYPLSVSRPWRGDARADGGSGSRSIAMTLASVHARQCRQPRMRGGSPEYRLEQVIACHDDRRRQEDCRWR
jgi:hypothetical protein